MSKRGGRNDYGAPRRHEERLDLLDMLRRLSLAPHVDAPTFRSNAVNAKTMSATSATDDMFKSVAQLIDKTGLLSARAPEVILNAPSHLMAAIRWSRAWHSSILETSAGRSIADDYLFRKLRTMHFSAVLDRCLERFDIVDSLPLVDSVISRFGKPGGLRGVVALVCQHLLGSTLPQMLALQGLGITPEHTFIIGKPYSSSRPVFETYKRHGFRVVDATVAFPQSLILSRKGYDGFMRDHLEGLVAEAMEEAQHLRHTPRLLVIDDGGLLISTVSRYLASRPEIRPEVTAIEQTSGGLVRLEEDWRATDPAPATRFPVISVAQSLAKLRTESPVIAASVVDQVQQRLNVLLSERRLVAERRFLIVGYGAVGAWIARELRNRRVNRISVWDIDSGKVAIAAAQGFDTHTERTDAFANAEVVVAATGHSSFAEADVKTVPAGAVLASAGSSNREFGAILANAVLHRGAWGAPRVRGSAFEQIHRDYDVDTAHGVAHIVNGGFPVNFDGSTDPIPPRAIQLTRALMVSAMTQVATESLWWQGNVTSSQWSVPLRSELSDYVEREALELRDSAQHAVKAP
jgi:hypothetical protein